MELSHLIEDLGDPLPFEGADGNHWGKREDGEEETERSFIASSSLAIPERRSLLFNTKITPCLGAQ